MSNFSRFCFEVWKAGKSKNELLFNKTMSKNVHLFNTIEKISEKDFTMLLYGMRNFQIKNTKWVALVEKALVNNMQFFKTKNIFLQIATIFTQRNYQANNLWKNIENQSYHWVNELSMKELALVCVSHAQNWKNKRAYSGQNQFWNLIEVIIRKNASDIDSNTFSRFVWAFGKVEYQNISFWKFVTNIWVNSADKLVNKEIARIYYAYAKIYQFYQNKNAISILEKRLLQIIPNISSLEYLKVTYSISLINSQNVELLKLIEREVLLHINKNNIEYISILATCFAKLQIQSPEFYNLFIERIKDYVVKYQKRIKLRDLSSAAWAMARVWVDSPQITNQDEFWNLIEEHIITSDFSSLRIDSFTMLLWSFHAIKKGSPTLYQTFASNALAQIPKANLEQLSVMLNVFSFRMIPNAELWKAFEERAQELIKKRSITHFHLSKLSRSFGKVHSVYKCSESFKNCISQKFIDLYEGQKEVSNPNDLFDYVLGLSSLEVTDKTIWEKISHSYPKLKSKLKGEKTALFIEEKIESVLKKELKPPKASMWTKRISKNNNV